MESEKNYIEEEKISLGFLIRRLLFWINFLISKWLTIGLGTLAILFLVVGFNYWKPKTFTAKTTFVLDNDNSGGLGDLGSIASLAGFNVGGLAEGGLLFQIDNIQELYRSNRMLEKTLLSQIDFDGDRELVIERFAESNKLTNKWLDEGVEVSSFTGDRESFTRKQDSLLLESIKLINEKFLFVDKPNRKTTILQVGFRHKDELLAKLFTETHVRNVNQFYLETKTKKSSANLSILQSQADSIKRVLDESILNLARIDENMPNPNPLYKTSQVPYQKAMIDVQANSAIYQEVVKQLELAKVANRNQMPLIQVIDKPILPLPDNKWKLFKSIVVGSFLGLCIMTLFCLIKEIIARAVLES